MESLILRYIFQTTNKIWLLNNQYGFLPGFNTMDAIAQVNEDYDRKTDKKTQVYAISFDFAKAFDMVDHEHLLQKISIKK